MPGGAADRGDNVIDLVEWRATRRPGPIPGEVLAEVDAASRVYDALLAQGHELRFDVAEDEIGADRVRVELRVVGGEVVRHVTIREMFELDGPPAA